jgi:hypothetical protein
MRCLIALADQWNTREGEHFPRLGVALAHGVKPTLPHTVVVVRCGLLHFGGVFPPFLFRDFLPMLERMLMELGMVFWWCVLDSLGIAG